MKRLTQFVIAGFLLAFLMLLEIPLVAAGAPVVVQGTNTFPADLTAVQTAVDDAEQVILEGTFDFGDGTLSITRDVTLRGRHGAVILNGGAPAPLFRPTIFASQPAAAVEIRDLTMEGSADIAIVTDGVTADIRGNNIALASTGFAGILPIRSSGSIIRNNVVTNTPVGILVELSDSVDVRNNDLEALSYGILLVGTSQSTFTNNSVSIVGDTGDIFGVGRVGVFLAPLLNFDDEGSPIFLAGNNDNSISNTNLEGEMTYGFLLGEGAEDNNIFIAPRNLDGAIFVDQPPDNVKCDTDPPNGATVLFIDDEFVPPPSKGNTVRTRARTFTFIDCGVDNVVE